VHRHKPGQFDTFLFADYSGAASGAAQRRTIALFRTEAGAKKPARITGPFTRVSLRETSVQELEDASKKGRRVLFGIDHQWSWPKDVLLAAGLAGKRWRQALSLLDWSEHERDAALTCLWANEAPLASLMDLRKAPIEARTRARIEGWILGARPATVGL
jgi:hypothetical protein